MYIYKYIATLKNDRNIILHFLSRMWFFYLWVLTLSAGSSSADRGGADWWRWKGGQWGTTNQWEHHGMGVYQINHFMAIWWDFICYYIYIYIFTIVYRFIYMGQHTTGWLVLVRCHVLPSFKGVNYQSIQGWQSCTAVFFFYGFSRNSTEIMVYGEYIYVILCTKNCTAGWFANGGNRQITTGGPTLYAMLHEMHWSGRRMNFVWHVRLQWSSQLKTIWFEVIETETSQDSHVIKWATDSTQYSIYTWQRLKIDRDYHDHSWPLSKNPDGHVHVHCHH